MQWLILAAVAFLVYVTKTGGAKTQAAQPSQVAMATKPAPTTVRAVRLVPVAGTAAGATGGVTAAGIIGYAQSAYKYLKQLYDVYKGISYATEAASAAEQAATIGLSPAEFAASQAGNVAAGIDEGVNAALAPAGTVSSEIAEVAPGVVVGATVGAEAGAGAVGIGLTGVGTGIYAGTSIVAGVEVATVAGTSVVGTVGIGGAWLAIGFIVEELVNLGLNNYKTGQVSKEIMRRKQIAIMQQGAALMEQAIGAAATFADALNVIAHAPAFTSGQVQFGIGDEYAGMHFEAGRAGTTETGNWPFILAVMKDPVTLREHPELIANFIANLWVQTGPGGATAFDQHATFLFRLNLLSKLPYTPDWNYIRTIILNMHLVDPRDIAARNAAIDAVPIPPEDNFIRLGWARVPTDRTYQYYDLNTSPPSYKPSSAEIVAYNLWAIAGDQPWTPVPPVNYYYDSNGQLIRIGQYDAPVTVGGNGG